jgi:hypothetical protein
MYFLQYSWKNYSIITDNKLRSILLSGASAQIHLLVYSTKLRAYVAHGQPVIQSQRRNSHVYERNYYPNYYTTHQHGVSNDNEAITTTVSLPTHLVLLL